MVILLDLSYETHRTNRIEKIATVISPLSFREKHLQSRDLLREARLLLLGQLVEIQRFVADLEKKRGVSKAPVSNGATSIKNRG